MNNDADGLSRMPLDTSQFTESCSPDTIVTVCCSISALEKKAEVEVLQGRTFSNANLRKEQSKDEDIGSVIPFIQNWVKPSREVTKDWSAASKCLLRDWPKLKMINGLLRREISLPREGQIQQLVLPKYFRTLVLKHLHDDLRHLAPRSRAGIE